MGKGNAISVKREGIEKTGVLLGTLINCVDFKKKFRVTVEYDPELENAEIHYEEINKE